MENLIPIQVPRNPAHPSITHSTCIMHVGCPPPPPSPRHTSFSHSHFWPLQGMAMGAQGTIVDTLHIFIAIMAHKGLAAYALGSSIVDSGASRTRFWVVIGIFAVATPVGIALGRILASESDSVAAAALSALASGTPSPLHSPKALLSLRQSILLQCCH